MPKVATVVLNYNAGEFLSRALESLRAQTSPHQIFLLDNASSDGSFEEARERFPEARSTRFPENRGFAASINEGMRQAFAEGADFVWLFNPDAEASPDALAELIRAAHSFPEAGLFSPVIENENGAVWFSGGTIRFFRERVTHRRDLPSKEPYATKFLTGCALFIPRRTWELLGGLDERFFLYYEDADYSYRARKMRRDLLVVPSSRVRHAEQSEARESKTYWLVFSGLLFFAKHRPGFFRVWFPLCVTIRRIKNALDRFGGKPKAEWVARAYRDFLRKRHAGSFPHFR